MRRSEAGLALITRVGPTGQDCLVQWNERWQMFSLIGGHVEPGETFRECCRREVEEELGLTANEFRVGESLGRIDYEAFSHGSGQTTRYVVELFVVDVVGRLNDEPANRWVTADEIQNLRTTDGLPVSEQVRTVLGRTGIGL